MAQVIQNLMNDQTTEEEIFCLSGNQLQVMIDLLQQVSSLVVVKI